MLNFSIPAANCSRDTFTSQYRNFIISRRTEPVYTPFELTRTRAFLRVRDMGVSLTLGVLSLIPVAQKQKQHLTANSPDPRERNRSCFFRHFMERARNAAICALVQVAVGSNLPPPTPAVMPFSKAQATALA